MTADDATPDAEILVATARGRLLDADRQRLAAALDRGPDWTALVRTALAHGTAGLLCRHLLDTAADRLPAEIAEAATVYLAQCREADARAVAELLALLDALAAAGIAAMPFKGPAFACRIHADPALRSCRDLDLLIRERDIAAAFAALERLGYRSETTGLKPAQLRAFRRYSGQDLLFAEERLPVEPHWQLTQRVLRAEIDLDGIWDRALPQPLGGRELPGLGAEDMATVAGLHGSKEEWRRLIWIADMAELMRTHPGLDWQAALDRAAATGIRRMLLLGLALAHDLLAAPLAAPAAAALAADPACRALAARAAARLFDDAAQPASIYRLSGFRWRMRERLADRLRYALTTLTTAQTQHFLGLDLPQPLAFLDPPLRGAHDVLVVPAWRAGRAVRRMWRRT